MTQDAEKTLPKLTEAQGELIGRALCEAVQCNSPSQLAAIRKALVDECREINSQVAGS